MTQRILILGGGTGGTIMANRLERKSTRHRPLDITVVDQTDTHVYQPGLLFVPFGLYRAEDIVRPRAPQLRDGVRYVLSGIDRVLLEKKTVVLSDGQHLPYDVLIIATGAEVRPEETEGMTGPGWRETVFDFYTLPGASALRSALENFERGRLLVNVVDTPIKCPVAPLEFAFLADWFFTERGVRDAISIDYVTPLDGAFTKPVATQRLHGLLDQKRIGLVTDFFTGSVDGRARKLSSYDGRTLDFDLLVTVPVHCGADFIGCTEGLGDELNFVRTDPRTLQSLSSPNVFALGDVTTLPTSKAGSVTHFEADVLTENVLRFLDGKPLEAAYDGHANCFVETGFHKAMLIDFNYEQEPLPGRFPFSSVGPMPLLEEARINHLGKLMFQWVYWNALLPGRNLPFIPTQMNNKNAPDHASTRTGE